MSRYPVELYVRFFDPHVCAFVDGNAADGVAAGAPRPAVFLDRDGVMNRNDDSMTAAEFDLLPAVGPAVRRLNEAGLPVVVVTNQGGVALEYTTIEELDAIHAKMARLLAVASAHVEAIYGALAYPDATIAELRMVSEFRKPAAGMLYQASDDLAIDLSQSVMVGDTTTDVAAGRHAGCTSILVRTGFGGSDRRSNVPPDITLDDITAAVEWILARRAVG